jgi:hypothetical protein
LASLLLSLISNNNEETMLMNVNIQPDHATVIAKSAPVARGQSPVTESMPFSQILKKATRTATPIKPEPASLSRLIKPRSPLELKSLNPTNVIHKPQPAALERTAESRLLPFALSNH